MLLSIKQTVSCFRVSLLVLVVLAFSACSTFKVSSYFQAPDWQAAGKLAIRASEFEGGKNRSVSFRWRQRGDASLIEFFSPLGMRLFLIQKLEGRVVLIDNTGKMVETNSIAELAYSQMGVYLPLDNLSGLMFESGSELALQGLDNAGWSVKRSLYQQGRLRKLTLMNTSGTQLIFLVKSFE